MKYSSKSQSGFTLMEILVSTSIFAGVLLIILSLFNFTLKINRRVEGLRQVSQATRNFTEFMVREVRNGSIDYTGTIDPAHCPAKEPVYNESANQFLALVNRSGDRECFFLEISNSPSGGTVPVANLMVTRRTVTGQESTEQINPPNITIDPDTFRFIVRPTTDPQAIAGSEYPGIQPFVTLVMNFSIQVNATEPTLSLPYQTTVSTDAYDTPHR